VLTRSSGASFILERKLSALVAHDYRAGFFIDLAWKDLRLAIDLAERAGARTEVASQACELYGEARQSGFGRLDSSGLLHLLEPRPALALEAVERRTRASADRRLAFLAPGTRQACIMRFCRRR